MLLQAIAAIKLLLLAHQRSYLNSSVFLPHRMAAYEF
jgi:hypothetical protein